MALLRYLKPSSKQSSSVLPDADGPLSLSIPSPVIREVNKVLEATQSCFAVSKSAKLRGSYTKFTPAQQAEIAKYASLRGNKAAIRHFAKVLGTEIKESSVCTWKSKYLTEIKRKVSLGETTEGGVVVNSLPVKKRGRPLLLGDKLDSDVKSYVLAVREAGGVINTAITMAVATAMVRRSDKHLLCENGGPIKITKTWAKSLLHRLKFVKRKACTSAKVTPSDFRELKEQFLIDIKAVVEFEEVPPDLVLNWDHTGINIVPGSEWTMELKGSKRVEVAGLGDKRQITAVFCGTLSGHFLPMQLIYQGKTSACLPRYSFPQGWNITCTPNHWSNEEKTKEYIRKVILPYVRSKRHELKLSANHPALVILMSLRVRLRKMYIHY